ncbi:MAG: c-type cytochrome [Bryobacterales bacterium]|nr:c-type cytochrome [Bryobacterales bacterium]
MRAWALALALGVASTTWAGADGFRLLEKHCLACHGEKRMGGLDLRSRDGALAGGRRGPALVPGKAEESLIYTASQHKGDLAMPPSRGPLEGKELEALRTWIEAGAPWPEAEAPQ